MTVGVRPSPSTSDPTSATTTGVSSSVDTAPAVAVGASLTGITAMSTVAGAEVACPSLTVKVTASSPFQSASGVKLHDPPAVHTRVPCAGRSRHEGELVAIDVAAGEREQHRRVLVRGHRTRGRGRGVVRPARP